MADFLGIGDLIPDLIDFLLNSFLKIVKFFLTALAQGIARWLFTTVYFVKDFIRWMNQVFGRHTIGGV